MSNNEFVGANGMMFCKECGEQMEMYINMPTFDGTKTTYKKKVKMMCRCDRKREKEQAEQEKAKEADIKISKLRKLSLIDDRLQEARFDTIAETDENRTIITAARRYVDNFDAMKKKNQGLVFYGNVGTGKSYTAATIANELIDRGHFVVMTSFVKILEDMNGFGTDISKIRQLNTAELLIIDDFGAERKTDFALETVYNIIDTRYRSAKPLILTTNVDISEMMNCNDMRYTRVYDRVFEMCYPIRFTGRSWRHKAATERFDDMKEVLGF